MPIDIDHDNSNTWSVSFTNSAIILFSWFFSFRCCNWKIVFFLYTRITSFTQRTLSLRHKILSDASNLKKELFWEDRKENYTQVRRRAKILTTLSPQQ